MVLPWPTRPQRAGAIAAAEQEKHRSQASAARAGVVERDILRLAAENHWADAVARTLRNGGGT